MLQQALSYLNEVKETITKVIIITIDQFVEKRIKLWISVMKFSFPLLNETCIIAKRIFAKYTEIS